MKERFEKLIKNPPAKYRGAPFWSWNGKLDRERMKEQIDDFEEMGFGGFHIHSRIGLEDEYLGREFLEDVKFCREYAAEKRMYTYLYDEDKWPSGYGAGRVTEREEYRARYLLFSPLRRENGYCDRHMQQRNRLTENGELKFLKAYRIELTDGKLMRYEALEASEAPEQSEGIWYAYRVVTDRLPWFNNAAYADTLNPEVTEKFLEVSYEPYAAAMGNEFSKTIPSIFTDEPQFVRMQSMKSEKFPEETGIPYTDRCEKLFREKYGISLLERLPEIFWTGEDNRISSVRYRYMDMLSDMFAQNYAGILGEWCERNHIMLAGHLMEENGLENQLRSVGEAMRSYARFQMPGIDMLADAREYTTAKQAQSIVRQMGKRGLISELYGVTNWDYDFRGHKLQGDWQAALGVTVRVPHLSWMYMGGESKRDYPAPIDSHSPWYKRYGMIEDYFARVNLFLDWGEPEVSVGVIHPIESMFMELGGLLETAEKRRDMEEKFQSLTRWLLFGLIDFDFISEALIPELTQRRDGCVGKMRYKTILVPELTTVRRTTIEFLESFCDNGGRVIVLGNDPEYMDGILSDEPKERLKAFEHLGYEQLRILKALETERILDIRDEENLRSRTLLCQIRRLGKRLRIFTAHGFSTEKKYKSVDPLQKDPIRYRMTVRGNYQVLRYDGMTGERIPQGYAADGSNTRIELEIHEHDSVLLELEENGERKETAQGFEEKKTVCEKYLSSETEWRTEEPNVLLLDMAEYAADGGEIRGKEELLKIDDRVRSIFGYRQRTDSFPQPWLTKEKNKKEHTLYLRFTVDSVIEYKDALLAFEGEEDCRLIWNHREIENRGSGAYYVDRAIRTVKLPEIKKGTNILECEIPFGERTNLEWFYLLGNFGVRLNGSHAVITELPGRIGFGDYAIQGFPFYGGSFIYETHTELPEGLLELTADEYCGALLEIQVDDSDPVSLFMAPYTARLGRIRAGEHKICIKCYGTRINTFGQLHNCKKGEIYFGPKTWRTQGEDWCYEYRLHTCGVLKAPRLRVLR